MSDYTQYMTSVFRDIVARMERLEVENDAMWNVISADCPRTDCPNWYSTKRYANSAGEETNCAGCPSTCPRVKEGNDAQAL